MANSISRKYHKIGEVSPNSDISAELFWGVSFTAYRAFSTFPKKCQSLSTDGDLCPLGEADNASALSW